eukprot:8566509-Lingulodinium_polyedra.AAC.1
MSSVNSWEVALGSRWNSVGKVRATSMAWATSGSGHCRPRRVRLMAVGVASLGLVASEVCVRAA